MCRLVVEVVVALALSDRTRQQFAHVLLGVAIDVSLEVASGKRHVVDVECVLEFVARVGSSWVRGRRGAWGSWRWWCASRAKGGRRRGATSKGTCRWTNKRGKAAVAWWGRRLRWTEKCRVVGKLGRRRCRRSREADAGCVG